MATIAWKKSFSVGIKEIDEQHKYLLKLINAFSEEKKRSSDTKVLFGMLNELVKYADSHFTKEEVFALNERLAKEDNATVLEITDFLKDWYISHVLGTDRGYVDFFAKKLNATVSQ